MTIRNSRHLQKNYTEVVAWLICDILNGRSRKNTLSFFLFTCKFIKFQILHSNWVRLNLFILCFIMVCLHGKVIVIVASDVFIVIEYSWQRTFNIECFKNFLSFSLILFTISGAIITLYTLTSVCIFSILFSIHLAERICWTIKRFFSLLLFLAVS